MKFFFVSLFICLICATSISQPNPSTFKWNLKKCLDYAAKNNISVKRADLQLILAKAQLKQDKQNKYPNISFSSSLSDQFGRSVNPLTYTYTTLNLLTHSYQFSGSVPIYNNNRVKNTVLAQEYTDQSSELDVEKTIINNAFNILNYYLQILISSEQIQIYQGQIAQTKKQLELTRIQLDAGSLPEINLIRLETQLESDSSDLLSAKDSYLNNMIVLKSLLSIDESAPFEIEIVEPNNISSNSLSELQPEFVYNLAIENQPGHKSDILKTKAAVVNINIQKAALYPSISIGYNIATGFSNYINNQPFGKWWKGYDSQLNNNANQQIALALNVPIFNNGRSRLNYEQAKINLRDVQLQQIGNEIELKKNIYSTYTSAVTAFDKLKSAKKIVEGLQKSYDILLQGYGAGGVNIVDLITTQNSLLRAKLQQVETQYDYAFKIKTLEFYRGN